MDLLLVEDKDSFRRLLVQALQGSVWDVVATADPEEALRALDEKAFDVLVTDLRLPHFSGLELIRRAKRARPELRVVLMSAFGEAKDIVEAMNLGAEDFLPKPFDLDAFLALLDRLRALVGAPPPSPSEAWIVRSPAMRSFDEALRRASDADLPVLFRGARGAGKARAARRLHTLRRARAPFLSLGAGSFLDQETRTLKLLQGGSIYVASLEGFSAQAAQNFGSAMESDFGRGLCWMGGVQIDGALDGLLQHRLGVLELHVPPLAERQEDLLPLFHLFLERAASRAGRPTPWLERKAERQLLVHDFPGNVRELEVLASRTLLLVEGNVIRSFPDLAMGESAPLCLPWPPTGNLDVMQKAIQQSAEAQLLRRALREKAGDMNAVAESLGLTLRVLGQRLKEHGIALED
jgi:DNA-binding NtrC family response regulator